MLEEDWEPPIPAIDFSALLGAVESVPELVSPVVEKEAVAGTDSKRPQVGPPVSVPSVDRGAASVPVMGTIAPGFGTLVADALERIAPGSGAALQPHQIPPAEFNDPNSSVTGFLLSGGRNTGKSYAGTRWLHGVMTKHPGSRARIIAPSFGDAVASCIEGPSGILEASNHVVQWHPSAPGGALLKWPNGSVCYVIGTPTAREVDRLRAVGNISYDLFEEAAANPQLIEVERQARLSRRQKGAKWVATTTPRPIPTIRSWMKDPTVVVSSATSHQNKYADPLWLAELETMYKGTRLYRQEVLGEVLEDVEGALWRIDHIERTRIPDTVQMYEMLAASGEKITRAAVGVDPGNTTGTTGIVTVLMSDARHLYVVEDRSMPAASANLWAAEAVAAARLWEAPIVAENDSGGDAIRAVLKAADQLDEISIVPARAQGRGSKGERAEPIALLWERDEPRGHIVGTFPHLESELTEYVPELSKSPDRLDAMVWACSYLWNRANYSEVTMHEPSHMGSTSVRRPGVASPWKTTRKRSRPRHFQE